MADRQPNIVVFVCDNFGWGQAGLLQRRGAARRADGHDGAVAGHVPAGVAEPGS